MSALTSRQEFTGTCIYLLLVEDSDGPVRCYIGQTDDFTTRLRDHNKKKAFSDRVVVVTSNHANLTKARG